MRIRKPLGVKVNSSGKPVVLASASPRRRSLLRKIIPRFTVCYPTIREEILPVNGLDPVQYTRHLASAKALNVAKQVKRGLVIGADTVVSGRGRIIGKPQSRARAEQTLRELSGTIQSVITGVCVINADTGQTALGSATTRLRMKKLSSREIIKLANSPRHYNKAGGYAIQEQGDRYIRIIKGRMDNAVGLPLDLVQRLIKQVI